MRRHGAPIRYAYVREDVGLAGYQTIFGDLPGSAEMASAARPFSERVVSRLRDRGVRIESVVLHTGVSSLEVDDVEGSYTPAYPEPFEVPASTASAIAETHRRAGRVIAVGTTVVRALESACQGRGVREARGFTRAYVTPERGIQVVDALLTGFHDPKTTHLSLLCAIGGTDAVREAYRTAIAEGYLWHEFGDSHLL
jgi:S-adenosylmethionine:tRNA ribosyltransferase-isomerase